MIRRSKTRRSKTLEDVARGDIHSEYVKVLDVSLSPEGRRAIVTLETNKGSSTELYESYCGQERGEWHELGGGGGLGSGWMPWSCEPGKNDGVLRFTDKVGPRVRRVVILWGGDEYSVQVVGGYFFFTVWNIPKTYEQVKGTPKVVAYIE